MKAVAFAIFAIALATAVVRILCPPTDPLIPKVLSDAR